MDSNGSCVSAVLLGEHAHQWTPSSRLASQDIRGSIGLVHAHVVLFHVRKPKALVLAESGELVPGARIVGLLDRDNTVVHSATSGACPSGERTEREGDSRERERVDRRRRLSWCRWRSALAFGAASASMRTSAPC
jgi:hypothetical protein